MKSSAATGAIRRCGTPRRRKRPDPAQQAGIENALRSFEERIASITEKLAETNARSDAQAPQGRAKSGLAGELQDALAEIRGRRDAEEAQHGARAHAAEEHLERLRTDVARLGAQLHAVKENGSRDNGPPGPDRHGSAACHG